jgi:F420-0:gamma-glutamyl ligase
MAGQTAQFDQVAVTLSPQHFKAFCKSLNETLEAFESAYGQLTISESMTRPLRNAAQIVAKIAEGQKRVDELRLKIAEDDATSSTEKKPPSKRSRGARKVKAS